MKNNFLTGLFKKIKNSWSIEAFSRLFVGVVVIIGVFLIGYVILKETGIIDQFDSVEKIRAILDEHHSTAALIYIGIQFLQVTFVPIPASITIVAGSHIFGPWLTLLYSLIAIIPASLLAFMLGRWLGKPFVSWMVGKDTMEKYLKKTEGKERTLFFTMFFLPFFPDDALCMIAGITPMSLKYFLMIQFITRPTSIIATCFLMSGVLIPFNEWWGILLYVLAFIGVAIALVLSYKFSKQIEDFVAKCVNKVLEAFHIGKKKGDSNEPPTDE